ncbi:agmatinase [Thermoleophilia bacterium SCSIO 60948]|nr:agmatinase [Thermoleophilia bacterium SCSIO 60948]
MLDPGRRWRAYGEKPDFAGLLSWSGVPYGEDPSDLEGMDAVVFGAPTDDLVSDEPGARLGPRGIRAASGIVGPRLGSSVDPFESLRLLDYGDAAVTPGDAASSLAAIRSIADEIVAAGAIPLMLGGDHSVTGPALRALAERHGALGLIHFDTHTDTGEEVFGVRPSHGTVMHELVVEGTVDPRRYVQIGLRGYWPGPDEFAWQRELGITSLTMDDIEELGLGAVVGRAVEIAGTGPVYVSVDIDVVDPSSAPGTGTPEPGGMLPRELLRAVTRIGREVELAGADIVEVIPREVGSADPTALLGDRVIRELVQGIAERRTASR